jgi:hypothetical protein
MTATIYRNPKIVDILPVCFNLRADEREQIEASTGQPYDPETFAVMIANKIGPAWYMREDETGAVIALAGFDEIRPGVWQDWMCGTDLAWDKYGRQLTRATIKAMNEMLKGDGLTSVAHRLQCVSLASRIHAHEWYAVLGLAPEGTLKGYGAHGEDFIMFARGKQEAGEKSYGFRRRQRTTGSTAG